MCHFALCDMYCCGVSCTRLALCVRIASCFIFTGNWNPLKLVSICFLHTNLTKLFFFGGFLGGLHGVLDTERGPERPSRRARASRAPNWTFLRATLKQIYDLKDFGLEPPIWNKTYYQSVGSPQHVRKSIWLTPWRIWLGCLAIMAKS